MTLTGIGCGILGTCIGAFIISRQSNYGLFPTPILIVCALYTSTIKTTCILTGLNRYMKQKMTAFIHQSANHLIDQSN